jgi:hypothetical protein
LRPQSSVSEAHLGAIASNPGPVLHESPEEAEASTTTLERRGLGYRLTVPANDVEITVSYLRSGVTGYRVRQPPGRATLVELVV